MLVDGGIRRGTDVLKALALGARAVLIGRPAVFGLALGGAEGVQRVIEILLAEFDAAQGLAGAPEAALIDRSFVTPAPWAEASEMNILVTGVSGYIGSLVVPRLLRDGHTVTGLARHPERLDPNGISLVAGDAVTGDRP